ncbi:hypothetical protein D3C78_427350 [compost metagenome]
MTAGLQGSGTEVDPWLITTMSEFLAVVRDASSSGFYRIANDISTGSYALLNTVLSVGIYAPKVIDCDGHSIHLAGNQVSSNPCAVFLAIHFINAKIHYRLTNNFSSSFTYLFYSCSLQDCAVYATKVTSNSTNTYFAHYSTSSPRLLDATLSRVAFFPDVDPVLPQAQFLATAISGVTASRCYVYATATPGSGLTKRTVPLTVDSLDALTGNAFSDAGWWQDGAYMLPWQSEAVALTLQTIAEGTNASRRLWLESERYTRYLGESDASGAAQFSARIRKSSGFAVLAAEDFGADDLRAEKAVAAGYWYLPPSDNGYIYQADIAGRISSLDGVTFADQPVLVDGITFTPRPRYTPVMSARRSVARNGATQLITLDNSGGGGGPVIDGDPAFLEGAVEEVHPMTGLRRALANCEVIAFERRGSDYVAMGSTYSDGIGGFRLETQVYGGGDVFAFAADLPGVIFQPGVALNIGDRIRPALANGYVYEIIEAGTTGATEPVWWPDQGDGTEGAIGTATARARPYYQPVGHGPLKMTPM